MNSPVVEWLNKGLMAAVSPTSMGCFLSSILVSSNSWCLANSRMVISVDMVMPFGFRMPHLRKCVHRFFTSSRRSRLPNHKGGAAQSSQSVGQSAQSAWSVGQSVGLDADIWRL